MRISDWSSDVCSSDLFLPYFSKFSATCAASSRVGSRMSERGIRARARPWDNMSIIGSTKDAVLPVPVCAMAIRSLRSEEHTSELQSLMRISYAVFCLKKKIQNNISKSIHTNRERYP